MYLKTWVFKGNPSASFKSCWRTSQEGRKLGSLLNLNFLLPHLNLFLMLLSQEGGKLGSLLNLNFLLPHLNLLLVLLSHLYLPGLNKLTLRGEGNPRVKRQWKLEDFVLPLKKRPTGQLSNRGPVMPPAEDQKGAMFNCQNPKHGSQPLCLVVSP